MEANISISSEVNETSTPNTMGTSQATETQATEITEDIELQDISGSSVDQSEQGPNTDGGKEDGPKHDTVPNANGSKDIASITDREIGSIEADPGLGTMQPSKIRILLWPTLTTFLLIPLSGILFWSLQQVMVSQHPKFGRIALSPSHTLLLMTVVTQAFLLILHILVLNVLDALRWQLAVRASGVALMTFLGLSSGTSLYGAINLIWIPGRHRFWTAHKFLLPILFLLGNTVLKAGITFTSNYETFPANVSFAGLSKINVDPIRNHTLPVSILTTYYGAWFTSIQGVSKWMTSYEPWYCSQHDANCTSLFLPGGVEQVRLPSADLGLTLLQQDRFKNADVIIVYNASGYHLDFFPPRGGFRFADGKGCNIYGQTTGHGLYFCVGTDLERNLAIGWSICPTANNNDGTCFTNTTWTQPVQQLTAIASLQRFADTVYDAKNYSILDVHFTGYDNKTTYLTQDFALIFDQVLSDTAETVPFNTTHITPDDTVSVDALNFQLGWALRLYQDVYPSDTKTPLNLLQNMLLIPIQFSIAAWQYANATMFREFGGHPLSGKYAMPDELEGKLVAGAKSVPRVAAVPWSVYTFIGGVGTLFLYVAAILGWVLIQKAMIPNGSGFAELMFAGKAKAPDGWAGVEQKAAIQYLWDNGMGNSGSAEAVKRVANVDIRVGVIGERIVMVVVEKGRGREVEEFQEIEKNRLYL